MSDIVGFWTMATRFPLDTAVIDIDGTPISFRLLLERVNRISNALIASGIGPGCDVTVLARNQTDVLAILLAASQIGAYFTLINSHDSVPEISQILSECRPRILFADARTEASAVAAAGHAGLNVAIVGLGTSTSSRSLETWWDGQPSTAPAQRMAGLAMLYTSGTSGRRKGVRPTLEPMAPEALVPRLSRLLSVLGIDPNAQVANGVHLVSSPLYHGAPMYKAILALHLGQTVVLMDRFDPVESLSLIQRHRVTWTQVVPTMMRRWMELDDSVRANFDLSSLRWLIHAAAPCPIQLKHQIIEWLGPIVYEYYSSTEAGGTSIGSDEWLRHPGSVGRAWPGASVRILDDDGVELPAGEVGLIYLLNIRPFAYYMDPVKTAAARRGEYVTVGDLGRLDDDGYLYIADRRSDLILVGGVNVYPAQIEEAIVQHPDVIDAAVIGIPDSDLGQVVHALVQPKAGCDTHALLASLPGHCRIRLGYPSRPRTIELRNELPRNEAGKLLRSVLRAEHGAAARGVSDNLYDAFNAKRDSDDRSSLHL